MPETAPPYRSPQEVQDVLRPDRQVDAINPALYVKVLDSRYGVALYILSFDALSTSPMVSRYIRDHGLADPPPPPRRGTMGDRRIYTI